MVSKVVKTAPERIWLQISDDDCHKKEPFPKDGGITWCEDSVMACEVEYVRADLVAKADGIVMGFIPAQGHE